MNAGVHCSKAFVADGIASPEQTFRRKLVLALGAGAFSLWIRPAFAQPARKPVKVGVMTAGTSGQVAPGATDLRAVFKEALRALGWVERRDVIYVERFYGDDYRKAESLGAELAKENVAVIFVSFGDAAKLASQGAPGIPIVFGVSADPVGAGIVASLARPGGNITGFSTQSAEIAAKRVQFLHELRPQMKRLANLTGPSPRNMSPRPIESAARKLGLEFQEIMIEKIGELVAAFDSLARWKVEGLVVGGGPVIIQNYRQVVEQAARIRVPAIYIRSDIVVNGGLMSYAPDFADQYRRAAGYVDRILKGAKPADLPVQQPTKFELVINMKTARALGLTIPPSMLVLVDRLIE